ncbi:M57 family metalloprotease [uncultured Polaribacter sp.]|uniref:M57 family metalloprotease n=1 Tax=uncultured Polaribacter sp. TaxID=174711 RepID=UPI00260BC4CA|nr:M57 family metalloprotease [uncultured Polaribacter sp.]
MKKIKLITLVLLCTFIQSCNHEDSSLIEEVKLTDEAQKTFNYLVEVENYDPNSLKVDYDTNSFFYEDDIAISFGVEEYQEERQASIKGSNNESARNRWFGGTVYYSNSRNITYYVNSNFPSNYNSALYYAIRHWNAASRNINFTKVNNSKQADIVIGGYYNSRDNAWARAEIPTGNGNVGSWLSVNSNYGNSANLNTKMVLLIHELGHNLGFEHSDSTRGDYISSTGGATYHTNNTCASIMRSSMYVCDWRTDYSGWSLADRRAIHNTYKYKDN